MYLFDIFFPLQGVDPQVLLQHQQQLPLQQGQPMQGQQQQHHEVIPDGDQQSRFQVSPITEERPANLAFDQKGMKIALFRLKSKLKRKL